MALLGVGRLLEDYTFTLWDPAGNQVGVLAAGGLAVNVPLGQGIWTVAITQGPGGGNAPLTKLGGAPVNEPFVTDNTGDTVIRLQFAGTPVTCPDTVTGTATAPTDCSNVHGA